MPTQALPVRPRESCIILQFRGLETLLEPWRSATIPVASKGVPPHLSLLYPWRPASLSSQDLAELRSAVAGRVAFPIQFAKLAHFSSNVLFLEPTPNPRLRELMQRVHDAFPDTPPYGGAFAEVVPHLTIASASSPDEFARLQREILTALTPRLPFTLAAEQLVVMEEDDAGHWRDVEVVALGDGKSSLPLQR